MYTAPTSLLTMTPEGFENEICTAQYPRGVPGLLRSVTTELEMMLQEVAVDEHTVAEHVCEDGKKLLPYTVTIALGYNVSGTTLEIEGCCTMNNAVLFTAAVLLVVRITSQYPKGEVGGTLKTKKLSSRLTI